MEKMQVLTDSFGRKIDYMRISITDRCNLRCIYCMPEEIPLLPPEEILTYDEIISVCQAAVCLGIRKFKITGGEPLVRTGCPELIGRLYTVSGAEQVTLTTNGVLLGKYLDALLENGLKAVNISLDTLNADLYRQMTRFGELSTVLENIERAVKSGLRVKINSVLQKGANDKEWEALTGLAKENRIDVRFIEMMPVGHGRKYAAVKGEELLNFLRDRYSCIEKDSSKHGNGPADYYRIPGFAGSIGFISAVHEKFCDSCNRIRMTAKGEIKPCLCYSDSIDMKEVLRSAGSEDIRIERAVEAIREAVDRKPRRHCFERRENISEKRQMVLIGG